jgi:anthranilate phosphoribosyltransferase
MTTTAGAAPAAGGFGLREALAKIVDRQDLSADEMADVVGQIMEGAATPAQVGGLLVALRMKGETVAEMVGAARAMRARMIAVPFAGARVVDTCGTGGDGSRSVNISTLASFIVAGCGVAVAKHGNRAQSSRSGSHDVIEALGINPAPGADLAARCLGEANLAFIFAQVNHAATRHVGGPRREIGLRTLFNMLGPLTNPCGARFHMNGIFSLDRCEPLARAHGLLGSERAMVVHGAGRLDEIAPAGETHVAELRDGLVRVYQVTPADFGLPPADPAGLAGGTPDFNAGVIVETLDGGGNAAVRNAALMAAGAALYVIGEAADLREGTVRAAEALDDGAARRVLERLRAVAPLPPPAAPAP